MQIENMSGALRKACLSGEIDVVTHLVGMGYSKGNICNWSAEGGHLEILKWARANGCPWDGS